MILVPSAPRTTSGNSGTLSPFVPGAPAAVFCLDVSAAATAVGDTLDVYVQQVVGNNAGTDLYDDFIHFTQVLGNGGAKRFVAQWVGLIAPTGALHAATDATLAAGVSAGPISSQFRVKWVVVSSSAPSFTFSVHMTPTLGSSA